MEIVTNNVPRHIVYGCELTEKERMQFDYYGGDEIETVHFARFKGNVVDLNEFMVISKDVAPHPQRPGWEKWHGYSSDSFFSGLLVKYLDDDTVVMGTYYC